MSSSTFFLSFFLLPTWSLQAKFPTKQPYNPVDIGSAAAILHGSINVCSVPSQLSLASPQIHLQLQYVTHDTAVNPEWQVCDRKQETVREAALLCMLDDSSFV